MFFSSFSIANTSLGEDRTNFSAFRTFVRLVLVSVSTATSASSCFLYALRLQKVSFEKDDLKTHFQKKI